MKRAIILALAIVMMVGACKKENIVATPDLAEQRYAGMEGEAPPLMDCDSVLNHIRVENGMLEISSWGYYHSVETCLRQKYEAHNDSFEARWGHLSDEAYNAKAEELGFDDEQPLRDFERQLGFNSLRALIERQTDEWLNHEELDPATDPEKHPSFDDVIRTLYNAEGKIKIGGQVFDCNTWDDERGGGDCKLIYWNSFGHRLISDPNRSMNMYIGHIFSPLGTWVGARVISYKKSGNHWNRYRTDLKVYASGNFYTTNCYFHHAFNSVLKAKKRKKLLSAYMAWGQRYAAHNRETNGHYWCGNDYDYLFLNW